MWALLHGGRYAIIYIYITGCTMSTQVQLFSNTCNTCVNCNKIPKPDYHPTSDYDTHIRMLIGSAETHAPAFVICVRTKKGAAGSVSKMECL